MATLKPKFWKPGTDVPSTKLKEEREPVSEGSGEAVRYNPFRSLSIDQQRQRLPVFKCRTAMLYLLEKFQTLVLIGVTGCGKSTQVPQYLYEAGWTVGHKMICVTQPRRVAAMTVASRVAEERGSVLGQEVGYTIRFDDCTTSELTRIKFVTDGLLIREMMSDPLLSKYSVIMVDEAHERTLYTDIIVGLVKKVMKRRPELRVIVSSATLDAEEFRKFFNLNTTNDASQETATILTVEGRVFPVDIHYALEPVPDYVKGTVETAIKIHNQERDGDILAFLTGQEEVDQAVRMLVDFAKESKDGKQKLWILPMYGSLPAGEQMRVFSRTPRGTRKIVCATNIAEASITINGVVYVLDCGFVKIRAYNPVTGIDGLVVVPVSQASSEQRAGRAGRVRSGKAYRLYPEEEFDKLPVCTVPEMQRSNMAPVVLQLKALGIDNVLRFDFLSPPPAKNMIRGLELLYALGALDKHGKLTEPLGIQMAEFPLHPLFAKILIESGNLECSEEIATIIAMLQVQNIFVSAPRQRLNAEKMKRKFAVKEGDHITLLNVYNSFIQKKKNSGWCKQHFLNYKGLCRAIEIREQMLRYMRRFKIPLKSCRGDSEPILRCITSGFFANAARMHYSGEYRTVREDHPLHIHPTSVLFTEEPPQWVIFNEVLQTTKEYMRDVSVIRASWLYELAPHFYEYGTEREIAAKRSRVE